MNRHSLPIIFSLMLSIVLFKPSSGQASELKTLDFDRDVAPVLGRYCLECHIGANPRGRLDLSQRVKAMQGGLNGPVIMPGQPMKSLLWKRVSEEEMPPQTPLPADAQQILKEWISQGASWGTDPVDRSDFTSVTRAGLDWWSLQPLRRPSIPTVKATDRVRNPVDAFVIKQLEDNNLTLSQQASPRVLIRRLFFDLVGLPPSPETLETFTQSPSYESYRRQVQQLLNSPHHGERWARHWLDVVRFGESDGFERNNARKTFWHYRDWVIQAFNEDMPYDEFVRMQIAGDLLTEDHYESASSLGFLVAGVHNTVVGGSERMRLLAREDELEEVIGTIGQTFLGLTLHCSRCHDHKFDPILQKEYYQLTSTISGFTHGEKELRSAEDTAILSTLQDAADKLDRQIQKIERATATKIILARKTGTSSKHIFPKAFASWEFDVDTHDGQGMLHGTLAGNAKLEDGALVLDGVDSYVTTAPLPVTLNEKTLEVWVQLDSLHQQGGAVFAIQSTDGSNFDSIVFGDKHPQRWMAGSHVLPHAESFEGALENAAPSEMIHFAITYKKDGTIQGFRNGIPYGKTYQRSGLHSFPNATSNIVFGRHQRSDGKHHFFNGRILKARLYDRVLSDDAIAFSAGLASDFVARDEILERLSPSVKSRYLSLQEHREHILEEHQTLSETSNFKIYTAISRDPGVTHLLYRGDVANVGPVVTPGAVTAVGSQKADFELSADSPESARRLKLANWITDRSNPLFARVIVNRLWHYHFGSGLVETPNDFGFNGGQPSHPKLLDWLAMELIENNYSLKHIHRLITTSSVFMQDSLQRAQPHAIDTSNRLLWRKQPQRLEAEALTDSILMVSGQLSFQSGGPGFEDVQIEYNNGTTYYSPIEQADEAFHRRAIYRFWPRGGRSTLLDTFDCPDPSTTAPKRTVTTTPLQALSLLNNAFVLRMSQHFAERIQNESGDNAVKQIARIYHLAYGRMPDAQETLLAQELIAQHGLSALTRAIINSSEFVFIQ